MFVLWISSEHIKRKSEAVYHLKRYVRCSERQTGTRVKRIVLDGGKEYHVGAETLEAEGIEFDKSAANSPEENGHAERMNRKIKNAIRAMIITSGAPVNYWAECLYAVLDAISIQLIDLPNSPTLHEEIADMFEALCNRLVTVHSINNFVKGKREHVRMIMMQTLS